jgi:hypothetical protein
MISFAQTCCVQTSEYRIFASFLKANQTFNTFQSAKHQIRAFSSPDWRVGAGMNGSEAALSSMALHIDSKSRRVI